MGPSAPQITCYLFARPARGPIYGFVPTVIEAQGPRRERVPFMKMSLMLAMVAALLGAPPAHAQRFDLAAVKCKDFAAGKKDEIGMILMWLGGYYSEDNASPVVDFDAMRESGRKISEYCGKNPADSVVDAADAVLGKDK